jgi:acetyl esterase/lipase
MKTKQAVAVAVIMAGLAFAQAPAGRGGLPEGIKALRDLTYVENGHERQKLDLYLPEKADGPLPLIIWIHGGGWQNGSKEGCPPARQGFLERGYAVASLNYRLSGHAVFPAQIEDCKAGVRWLRAHAKEYGIDPDRFGVWGSSAGGHLVALLGTSGDEKAFDVGPNLEVSSRVQAVCDYFGPTDLTRMDERTAPGARMRHNDPASPESALLGGSVQENKEKAARASPLTYVTTNALPPFLIVHGDSDPVVSFYQSELLFEALKKAGGSVHLHRIRGAGHGQGFGGKEIGEKVTAFFDRWLKAGGGTGAKPEAARTESEAVGPVKGQDQARGQPGPTGRQPERPRVTFEQVLAREDADKDGRVTKAEFKGPEPFFKRLDRTGDGVLTKEDFEEKR